MDWKVGGSLVCNVNYRNAIHIVKLDKTALILLFAVTCMSVSIRVMLEGVFWPEPLCGLQTRGYSYLPLISHLQSPRLNLFGGLKKKLRTNYALRYIRVYAAGPIFLD